MLTARIVGWLEKFMCFIFGHDIFDSPRFDYAWCVKCPKKWQRKMPLLGEFHD